MTVRVRFLAMTVLAAASSGALAADESVLPFFKNWAEADRLPLPFGAGVTLYYQGQDYDLKKLQTTPPLSALLQAGSQLSAGGQAAIPGAVMPSIDVENETWESDVKLDAWLLPCLNVFGLLGYVNGQTDVNLGLPPNAPFQSLELDYEGFVYGVGGTIAGGYKKIFASLTGTMTWTDLDEAEASVEAWVLAPKLGLTYDWGAVWVGATYQNVKEHHEGMIPVPMLGSVRYEVDLEQSDPWNYGAGISYNIDRHVTVDLEGGFGDRSHVALGGTYRF